MEILKQFIDFLNSYPVWAKTLAVGGLVLTIATLLLAPRTKDSGAVKPSPNDTDGSAHIVEFPFSCQIIGRKLHIYEDASGPINAGLPGDANIYIINEQSAATIANELVELSDGVQSIEQLRFRITYEYHADSTYNPARLEFVIKDKTSNQIWRGTHDFLPPKKAAKRKQISEFSFDIGRRYEGQSVTIQVKPLKAGDFGFYIYGLDGTLVVKVK